MNMLGHPPEVIERFRQYAIDHNAAIKVPIPPSLAELERRGYTVFNTTCSIVDGYRRLIEACSNHAMKALRK